MSSQQASERIFVVLDASIWVSRLVPQDEFHAVVRFWMEKQVEAGVQFISPTLLLPEVAGAITRRTGEPALGGQAAHQLESLPGLRLVEMDNELIHDAAILAAALGLRGADSVYVAVASHLHLPLITFDVDQRERARKKVLIQSIA